MAKPTRLLLRRAPGWRKPVAAVVVSRPTRWGNPFPVGTTVIVDDRLTEVPDRETSVALYRMWLDGSIDLRGEDERRARILDELPELRGKDLLCWCPLDAPCHADVLIDKANP